MSSQHPFDDALLTQYLLGALPEDQTERVDEASITNDEIALRLRAMENDLVDAYVRGELSGETLERFESAYLANPERRKRVVFATALRDGGQPAANDAGRWLAWAAAAVIAVLAIGYAISTRRSTQPAVRTVLVARAPVSQPHAVVTLLLLPPTRGVASMPQLRVPDRNALVILRLQLESGDFPAYSASVRDLVTNEIVAIERLKPVAEGDAKIVSVTVPASTFKEQNYTVEVSGLPPGRPAELMASYAFHVTLR